MKLEQLNIMVRFHIIYTKNDFARIRVQSLALIFEEIAGNLL